jgi:hypothetical protein
MARDLARAVAASIEDGDRVTVFADSWQIIGGVE